MLHSVPIDNVLHLGASPGTGRFLLRLVRSVTLPAVQTMDEKPGIDECEQGIVGDEDGWVHPLPAVEFPIEERPKNWGGKKCIGMRRHVDEKMQAPRREFPHGPSMKHPDDEKHQQKHQEAVRHIVESVDVLGNRRFRRCAMAEVGFLGDAENDGCP
jgi:hypothetical protein